jgi:methyl-accepting chemotaxis protein
MIRDLSVRYKVSGIIFVVVIATVAFQIFYVPAKQIELLTSSIELKAMAVGRLLATEVRPGLEFDDHDGVRETLAGSGQDPDLLYAVLFKDNGEPFAQFDPKGRATQLHPGASLGNAPSSARLPDEVRVTFPVVTKGGVRGTLVVGLGTAGIEGEVRQVREATYLVVGATLLIGLIVAILGGAALGRRLTVLTAVAARVARGDLKAELPSDSSRDEIGQLASSFSVMVTSLRGLERHVLDVANGNLSSTAAQEGDVAAAVNLMILSQRELVKQIADTAVQLNAAAGQFLANAKAQERGATEQSSAVEETRRTMESLRSSSGEIARAATDVLANAERAQQNGAVVSERIAALSQHTTRITEILEVIKGIANKSDLLALNAALEGTKAGAAGRGFSLVATQMQRLSESVMRSVSDIKDLTGTVRDASQASVLATEVSKSLADATTLSARQIGALSSQQQTGTEQATVAMRDVAEVAAQTAVGSKEIVASASDLTALSRQLQKLVGRFRIDESQPPRKE